jgi:hypothetical protein
MKRSIISLLAVGLCAGAATVALAQNVTTDKPGEPSAPKATVKKEMTNPGTSKHDKGDAAFKKADKDHDGTLDRKEAKAMKNVAKHFDAIDTDKDGTVSLDEVHTYMKAQHNAAKS